MGHTGRKRVLRQAAKGQGAKPSALAPQPAVVRKGENAPAGRDSTNRKEQAVSSSGQNTGANTGGRRGRIENLRPPWPKGVSGNPGGRPRKQPITEAHFEVATQQVPGDPRGRTYAQAAAERQFRAALKGGTPAIREIADRIEGKPK
jgi:hypothetical protein